MATAGRFLWSLLLLLSAVAAIPARGGPLFSDGGDGNDVYSPCEDSKVKRYNGFTLGLIFSTKDSFYDGKGVQLSPCDSRLRLSALNVPFTVFRPFVDEISLLSINSSSFGSLSSATHMVAFAGRKYAARSLPKFVGNDTYIVTSFTLVLEFQVGTLQNLYWKTDGCAPCADSSIFVCLNDTDCAIPTSKCIWNGGSVDCNLGIQLAFSGTDRYDTVLNSWYEVSKLHQYSLYSLFSDLKGSFFNQFGGFFG